MDFITLATETDPRQMLRYLTDVTGEDDDMGFVLPSNQQHPAAGGTGAGPYIGAGATTSADYDLADRPVFSKTAEAELYMLATNFLVYVTLVIVTIVVAKIYFPEALERGSPTAPRARSYSYRMAAGARAGEEYYGSDAEDEEGDDGDGDNDDEVLDSGDEAEEDRDLLNNNRGRSQFSKQISSLLEFQQESLSKTQVLKRLIFCSLMLNLVFVMWGALQVCTRGASYSSSETPESCLTIMLLLSGTHADSKIPSLHGRILCVFLRTGFYQSLLDSHHVGYANAVLEAPPESVDSHLRILVSVHLEHVE
jgi:hypothetical protein